MKKRFLLLFSMITLGILTTSCDREETTEVKEGYTKNQTLSSIIDLNQVFIDNKGIDMANAFLNNQTTARRLYVYMVDDCTNHNGDCNFSDIVIVTSPTPGYSMPLEDFRKDLIKGGYDVSLTKNVKLDKLFFHVEKASLPVQTIAFQIVN